MEVVERNPPERHDFLMILDGGQLTEFEVQVIDNKDWGLSATLLIKDYIQNLLCVV